MHDADILHAARQLAQAAYRMGLAEADATPFDSTKLGQHFAGTLVRMIAHVRDHRTEGAVIPPPFEVIDAAALADWNDLDPTLADLLRRLTPDG